MSGLYVLLLLAIWLGIGYGAYFLWRYFAPKWAQRRRPYAALGLVGAAVWLLWLLYELQGRKMYYDAQVRELCAKDGGVRVYETVRLPAERFDRSGNVGVPNKRHVKPSDEYFFEVDIQYYRRSNPSIERARTTLVRRSDGKVLGESIRYGRGGGDLPGPWHDSSFDCPPISKAEGVLETSIFVREEVAR